MRASRLRHRPLPLGLVLAGVGTCVLLPTSAQAVENVSSYYRVGCTVYPDDGYASSQEPDGVAYDGPRNDVAASPAAHLVTGSTIARYSMGTFRENCDVNGAYQDQLTVRPGTSGLSEGAEITVQVAIEARGSVGEVWGSEVSFSTLAEYGVEASIQSLDDCTYDGEGTYCTEPVRFAMERQRQVYGNAPGSVDLYYRYSHELTADSVKVSYDSVYEEYTPCASYPENCSPGGGTPPPAPDETFVATATLVVGSTYLIEGDATALTSAGYHWPNEGGDQLSASAAVSRFLLELNPTAAFAGVELAYASAGATDTVAPVISGAEDVTVESANGTDAVVSYAVTATDDSGGPVTLACDPPSGSTFPVGQTQVNCDATDEAGNTATAQFTVTVTAPPPMELLGGAIAEAAVPAGIRDALQSKYDTAAAAFARGDTAAGCGALGALANHVRAQTGKKIPPADAATLQRLIQEARAANGC